jgi:hypothetical protein
MATYLHCPACQRAFNLATAAACPRCHARPGAPLDPIAAVIDAAEPLAAAINRATSAQLAAAAARLAARRGADELAGVDVLRRLQAAPAAAPRPTLGGAMLALLPRIAPRNDGGLVDGLRRAVRALRRA